jgi:hypothetical protein
MRAYLLSLLLCITAQGFGQLNIDTASFNTSISSIDFSKKNSLVVIGEAHEVKNTYLTEFFLLKKLFVQGFTKICIEGGSSEAAILNEYLHTGNDSILSFTRASSKSGEYKQFVKQVYAFNKEQNNSIAFEGIDFERTKPVSYLFSKWFSNNQSANALFNDQLAKLLSITPETSDNQFERTIKECLKNQSAFSEEYKSILQDNYPLFISILNNNFYFSKRDESMVEKLLQLESKGNLNNAILIIGSNHLVFNGQLSSQLFQKLNGEKNIVAFIFAYANCENYLSVKKFNSENRLLKLMIAQETSLPSILFSKHSAAIVHASGNNVKAILVGLYNQ